nr:EAL domain-containing protein [Paraburkholderia mimosarum]
MQCCYGHSTRCVSRSCRRIRSRGRPRQQRYLEQKCSACAGTIAQDTASSVVAPHIISMGHKLGLEIVAEGVESGAQAEWLRERGVQYGQGWYFAKAMTADELVIWVVKHRARHEAGSLPTM